MVVNDTSNKYIMGKMLSNSATFHNINVSAMVRNPEKTFLGIKEFVFRQLRSLYSIEDKSKLEAIFKSMLSKYAFSRSEIATIVDSDLKVLLGDEKNTKRESELKKDCAIKVARKHIIDKCAELDIIKEDKLRLKSHESLRLNLFNEFLALYPNNHFLDYGNSQKGCAIKIKTPKIVLDKPERKRSN